MASFDKVSSSEDEGTTLANKYGAMVPKKKPLISKPFIWEINGPKKRTASNEDHGRAFFDSADWALCKQGAAHKSKIAVESLRPKLQRTPHQQLPPRRPSCTSGTASSE